MIWLKIIEKQLLMVQNVSGFIVFQVYSGNLTLPISNAKITLYRQIDNNIYFYQEILTDISGKTEPICVFAPSISLSQSPLNPLPYYSYQARIEADGYDTVLLDDIRAFRGVTSIQPVPLEPTIPSI